MSVVYSAGLRQRSVYGLTGTIKLNVTIRELMYRKGQVIRQELDIIQQNMARHQITVFNYPTLGEAYKVAAHDGFTRLEHRI